MTLKSEIRCAFKQSKRCAVTIVMCLSWQITLVKSGGGFFPLHRFESAHTAFLIIVRRFCLANNLQEENLTIAIKVALCFPVEETSKAENVRLKGYLLHQ